MSPAEVGGGAIWLLSIQEFQLRFELLIKHPLNLFTATRGHCSVLFLLPLFKIISRSPTCPNFDDTHDKDDRDASTSMLLFSPSFFANLLLL